MKSKPIPDLRNVMIKIIIDTSALRQANAAELQELAKLEVTATIPPSIWHNKTTLAYTLIPDLVGEEMRTQLTERCKACLKSVNELRRDALLPEAEKRQLQELADTLRHLCSTSYSTEILQQWLDRHSFQSLPAESADFEKALNGYFVGAPPYKGVKDRYSIPDGVICEVGRRSSVRTSVTDPDLSLHFICHDNALRQAVSDDPGIFTYKSVNAFLNTDIAKRLLELAAKSDLAKEFDTLACDYAERWKKELAELCLQLIKKEGADWINDTFHIHGLYGRQRFASAVPHGDPTDIHIAQPDLYSPGYTVYPVDYRIEASVTLEVPMQKGRRDSDELVYLYDGQPYQRITQRRNIDVEAYILVYTPGAAEIKAGLHDNRFTPPYLECSEVRLSFRKWQGS